MTFPRIPFPVYFWVEWARRDISYGRFGGEKQSKSHFEFHTHCQWSAGSPCWCELATGPVMLHLALHLPQASLTHGPGICFLHQNGPWCMQDIHTTIVRGNKNWHGFQYILVGFQLMFVGSSLLLISLSLHPSSIIACLLVDFELQHETWRQSLTENASPIPTCIRSNPSSKSFNTIWIYLLVILVLWLNPDWYS